MKKFVLDHFQSVYCDSAVCRRHVQEGDLLIQLATGQKIAVIVVNRPLRLDRIRARYESNTAQSIHTLYLLDQAMLPSDHGEIEAPAWMLALHNLTNGRIYAYQGEERSVTIRPLHLGWKWRSKLRVAQYGEAVDVENLTLRNTEATVGATTDTYATADFNEGVFWKKQEPRGAEQNYYSWRTWRYSERSARQQQEQTTYDQETWEPWEEFNRRYGSAGHYTEYTDSYHQRQAPPRTSATSSDRTHYITLGVSMGASLDEIKQAYRRKARENHPDLHPEQREKYTAKMADINAAFEAISKKFRR